MVLNNQSHTTQTRNEFISFKYTSTWLFHNRWDTNCYTLCHHVVVLSPVCFHLCLASYSKIHSRLNFATTMYYKRDIRFITRLLIHVKLRFCEHLVSTMFVLFGGLGLVIAVVRCAKMFSANVGNSFNPLWIEHLRFWIFEAPVLPSTSYRTVWVINERKQKKRQQLQCRKSLR